VLDYAGGNVPVAAELDGPARYPPAGKPGEQQTVEPDSGRRVHPAKVVHHLGATVDDDPDGARQRARQFNRDPGPVGRLTLPTT
jgi:hypothetical protein